MRNSNWRKRLRKCFRFSIVHQWSCIPFKPSLSNPSLSSSWSAWFTAETKSSVPWIEIHINRVDMPTLFNTYCILIIHQGRNPRRMKGRNWSIQGWYEVYADIYRAWLHKRTLIEEYIYLLNIFIFLHYQFAASL